jgi:transposase
MEMAKPVFGMRLPSYSVCSKRGLGFVEFEGTEDGELVEIVMRAHKRIYHRKHYCKRCDCEGAGIITAPPPACLLPKGKYGITIWAHLLLSKFL